LGIEGQTREVLGFVDRLLAHVGADKSHILSVRIYLASVGDYAGMNAVWEQWVAAGHPPARTTIGARLVNPDYKVEMEVTAAVDVIEHDEDCEAHEHHHHGLALR